MVYGIKRQIREKPRRTDKHEGHQHFHDYNLLTSLILALIC